MVYEEPETPDDWRALRKAEKFWNTVALIGVCAYVVFMLVMVIYLVM